MASKKWDREFNREKINAYYRKYYKKNKAKHIERVKAWAKKNPDKIKEYAKRQPVDYENRRNISKNFRERKGKTWYDYQRAFKDKQKQRLLKSKIVVPLAVERKRWHSYRVDKEGNIVETKIRGRV